MKWFFVVYAILSNGQPYEVVTPSLSFNSCMAAREAFLGRIARLDIQVAAFCKGEPVKHLVTYENL